MTRVWTTLVSVTTHEDRPCEEASVRREESKTGLQEKRGSRQSWEEVQRETEGWGTTTRQ